MSDIALDDDHDIAVAGNNLVLVTGADEVVQRLKSRLKLYASEWFLEPARGLPYKTEIFRKGISPDRIAAFFKREILLTPGVLQLLEYRQEIDAATRHLTIDFKAQASDATIIEISLGVP
jgi:hypothetical protein